MSVQIVVCGETFTVEGSCWPPLCMVISVMWLNVWVTVWKCHNTYKMSLHRKTDIQ